MFSPFTPTRYLIALLPSLAVAVMTVVAPGCVSQQTGDLGNLSATYVADDKVTDFNKAIAVGAKLDLSVWTATTPKTTVTVTAATSDQPGILKVASFQGNTLVLEATGEGSATIDVTAKKGSGEEVKDRWHMRGAKAQKLVVKHLCTNEAEGYYLTGLDIWVPYDLQHKNNEPAIGYGYFPFAVEPKDVLTQDQQTHDQAFLHFKTAATKGATATLSSTIDAAKLQFKLVDIGDADGILLGGTYYLGVGTTMPVLVRPAIGGKPICQARTEFTAKGKTDDVCSVKVIGNVNSPASAAVPESYGLVELKGLKAGKCQFEVTYPKGKGGAGVTLPLEVEVGAAVKPAGK
jgi:hypothetical protein